MNSKWYQCCYTNALHKVGDKYTTGWQQVAVSEDIPSEACVNCRNYQATNSVIQHSAVDEDGHPLNLLEIIGDGRYLYLIRTQYGLLDAHKRANMFSHAYVLHCKDADMISDPNTFLTIANENFCADEAKAEKTKKMDSLARNMDFSIEGSLRDCGLTDALYLTMVQCVYAQLKAERMKGPLYIECNGSDKQIRALLYLIYSGLSLSARRRLSVASCPKDGLGEKDIIFSKNAGKRKCYLIPSTGENNILTETMKRKFLRLRYINHAVENCHNLDMGEYFRELENSAMRLGDAQGTDEVNLTIAYQLKYGSKFADLDKDELLDLLIRALRGNVSSKGKCISLLVGEIYRRGYQLSDGLKTRLLEYVDGSRNKDLQAIADKYKVKAEDTGAEGIEAVEDAEDTGDAKDLDDLEDTAPSNSLGEEGLTVKIFHESDIIFSKYVYNNEELAYLLTKECIGELRQAVKENGLDGQIIIENHSQCEAEEELETEEKEETEKKEEMSAENDQEEEKGNRISKSKLLKRLFPKKK